LAPGTRPVRLVRLDRTLDMLATDKARVSGDRLRPRSSSFGGVKRVSTGKRFIPLVSKTEGMELGDKRLEYKHYRSISRLTIRMNVTWL